MCYLCCSLIQAQANRERELSEALESSAPSVVIFDRFYAEEMFSFRVRELCPGALRVLDMQGWSFITGKGRG